MTSNAGAQAIMEPKRLGFMSDNDEKKDYERMKGGVMEEVRRIFKPEFLNRIDEVVEFRSLGKGQLRVIVSQYLSKLNSLLSERGFSLDLSEAALNHLTEAGYEAELGARPLKRVFQREVQNTLATEILRGHWKPGTQIRGDCTREGWKFS